MKASCPDFKDISFQEYKEAICLAESQSFAMKINGVNSCGVLPFLDKFNPNEED